MSLGKPITITKREIVNQISEKLDVKQVIVKDVVQYFLDDIVNSLSKGDRLEFRDFGVFEVVLRKARIAQNPKTLEKVDVPARNVAKFKVGQTMKETIRKSLATKE